MENNNNVNLKEFDLGYDYTFRQGSELNAIFKKGKPNKTLNINIINVYNRIFDFKPKAKSVKMKKDKTIIEFIVESVKYKNHDLKNFYVNIGDNNYEFLKKSKSYRVEIPYDNISIPGKIAGVYLCYKDENGFMFKKKFQLMPNFLKRLRNKYLGMTKSYNKYEHHDLYYGELIEYENHSIYFYETWNGYLSLAFREINVTDDSKESEKIKNAFKKYMKDKKDGVNHPSVILYEKFCEKYEESARYVYERLIDDGCENVFFILKRDSDYWDDVPEKYKSNIIEKYSSKHYYEYFNAKAFISTETINHVIDLTTYNALTRRRQYWKNYYYIFLQHGVMYAYSIKGRWDFEKGGGFDNNAFVVVSSETEAKHFIEDGNFDREDLIKCGLPKFDYSIQYEDADKILIMPTSRNFEYSTIRDDTINSTYYHFSKKLINSVPEDLKDKIIFIPHPLVNAIFGKTDLEEYMIDEYSYDELLKNTRLLITDYSSISYDAFYRGCNIIFAWMEKEMCLNNLGIKLKLNDNNAFADIAYDYNTLTKLIKKNYYGTHNQENTKKYKDIVEFHDGKNTERFIEHLYNTNIFPQKAKKCNIKNAIITSIDYGYTNKSMKNPKIKLSYNGVKLIKDLDFKIKNYTNMETVKYKIEGMGIYKGSKTINYKIKKNIKKSKYKIKKNQLIILYDGEELIEGKDYTYEWNNYHDIALIRIVVEGIGDFTGKKTILKDTLTKNK